MYKDKPYSYAASRKGTPIYRQWRIIVSGVCSLLLLVYWLGVSSSAPVKPAGKGGSKSSSWSWAGKQGGVVDWDGRREAVKEAFKLSWDGYEQYAWGTYGRWQRSELVGDS